MLKNCENYKIRIVLCQYVFSLKIQKFFSEKPQFSDAKAYVKNLAESLEFPKGEKADTIVALGGTVRMLARVLKGDDDTNGYTASTEEIFSLCEKLMDKSVFEIKNIKGIEEKRADILKGGVTPLCAMAEYISAKEIIFSSSGVREGVLYEMLG